MSSFIVDVTDPSEIYDIKYQDDGSYLFTCFKEETSLGCVTSSKYDIVVKDNLITKIEWVSVCESNTTPATLVTSTYACAEFIYENVDFSDLDARVAAL